MTCDRCGLDHGTPMGLRLDMNLVDSATAREIRRNLEATGTYDLYFPPMPWSSSEKPYSPNFLEAGFVPPTFYVPIQSVSSDLTVGASPWPTVPVDVDPKAATSWKTWKPTK